MKESRRPSRAWTIHGASTARGPVRPKIAAALGTIPTMRDPDHEQYEHWNEWIGEFDSERFDVATATRRMQHGRCEEEIGD